MAYDSRHRRCAQTSSTADPSGSGQLYAELARMDSLVFDASFVSCDRATADSLFTDDAEFYHDRTGFKVGAEVRANNARLLANCPGKRGITRALVPGSLRVYPIADFGAVQMGVHRFVERGAATSTEAQFVHLWKKTSAGWKLSRVLSFEHRPITAP